MRLLRLSAVALALCFVVYTAQVTAAKKAMTINDVLEYIRKGDNDNLVAALSEHTIDVNTPDSKGRLAVVETVRAKNDDFLDTLIQYGAMIKVKEASSGATPLHVAFSSNQVAIAKTLLAHGADPNATDKANKKARDYAKTPQLKELVASYDKNGAMAFEDVPGTWIKGGTPGKSEYWFNTKSSESRWNTPPSCGWKRLEVAHQPYTYSNVITGQTTHGVPPALAWKRVRVNDTLLWYNWKVNMSQHAQPAEVPSELVAELEQQVNVRWWNTVSGELSWEDPALHTPWRKVEPGEGPGNAEQTYFYNLETGDSTWEMPDELAWDKLEDDSNPGQFYYANKKTGDAQWEIPAAHGWQKVSDEL